MIAVTDRLILRELSIGDAQSFFDLNNDPEVLQYTGDVPFKSVDEAENFLRDYSEYERSGFGRWAVIRREDHTFLGWCGLKHNEEGYVDIGFRFFQQFWGKGYATEAAQKCIDIGFSEYGLSEIIGRTAQQNLGSIRVLEKLGMNLFKKGECHGIENAMYFEIRNDTQFS